MIPEKQLPDECMVLQWVAARTSIECPDPARQKSQFIYTQSLKPGGHVRCPPGFCLIKHDWIHGVSSRFFHYSSAIASISQSTPFGRVLTATQLRAGFELKYRS